MADKVSSMLYTIVKKCSNFDDDDKKASAQVKLEEDMNVEDKRQARNVIKGKIKSVAAMSKMFSTLREE